MSLLEQEIQLRGGYYTHLSSKNIQQSCGRGSGLWHGGAGHELPGNGAPKANLELGKLAFLEARHPTVRVNFIRV